MICAMLVSRPAPRRIAMLSERRPAASHRFEFLQNLKKMRVFFARRHEFFENCFRILAMSSWEGGQLASHVLQWNTNAPDFNVSSNSFWLNVIVWLWSFGQTISKSTRSLMSLLLLGQSAAAPARSVLSILDGSASLPRWRLGGMPLPDPGHESGRPCPAAGRRKVPGT